MPEIATNLIATVMSIGIIAFIIAISLTVIGNAVWVTWVVLRAVVRAIGAGFHATTDMLSAGTGSRRAGTGRHAVGAPLADPTVKGGWEPETVKPDGEVTSFVWRKPAE